MRRSVLGLLLLALTLHVGGQPPAKPAVADPPAPAGFHRVALGKHTFTLPKGFTIELVAESPQVDRPVTAAFDDNGRLFVADSSGSNAKPADQLKNPTHRVVMLESTKKDGKFDKSTVFADKLSFLQGTMWRDGSLYVATPPTIQKLTDTDGDGVADKREVWFDGGVLTGCANDVHGPYPGPDGRIYWTKGAFAKQEVVLRGGKKFTTRAAHIYRAKPDGSEIEVVMTGGMDNPVDVAFTPAGEMFFTTTFFQHPANGKRDGIVHATYGAVYGKDHDVVNDHPWAYPTLNEPMTHLGPAAPAGLHCYRSGAFGEDYTGNLFACQFNLAKVSRHVLKPLGSTYRTEDSDFVASDNRDFHPTDVIEDADGSLLIVDTGGWYKLCCPSSVIEKRDVLGAIYRVRKEKPDPTKHDGATAFISSVWQLPAESDFTNTSKGGRLAAAVRAGVAREKLYLPELKKLLKDESLHVRRAAAEALGRIGDETAIPALLEALGSEPMDVPLQTALTRALIDIGDPVHIKAGLKSKNLRAVAATVIALGQIDFQKLQSEDVLKLYESEDETLRKAAVRLTKKDWPKLAEVIGKKACDQLDAETVSALLHVPAVRERMANTALSAYRFDRTVAEDLVPFVRFALGMMTQVKEKAHPKEWERLISTALKYNYPVLEAVAAARTLGADKWADDDMKKRFVAVAGDDHQPAEVRLSALSIVPKLDDSLFAFVMEYLKGSQPATLRSLAAEVLSKATLTPKQFNAVAEAIPAASPLDLDKLLVVFGKSTDEAVGLALVKALSESKVRAAIRAEQVKPVLGKYPPAVQGEAEKLYKLLESDRAEMTQKLDTLLKDTQLGDVRRGQAVFGSAKAACTNCHKVAYVGGLIGPDLTKIGSIRSEKDLLEAIVFPSASFVRSYEPVKVETKDGKSFNGILKADRPDEVVLTVSATEEVRIARKDIDEMKPGTVSVMPAGLDQQLTKQELADLVAFLKSLK